MYRRCLIGSLLVLVTLAVFWQVRYHEFVWDDKINIKQNPYLNPVTSSNFLHFWGKPYEGLYIPLTYSVWATVSSFAEIPVIEEGGKTLDPQPFHMANLIFHLLSA